MQFGINKHEQVFQRLQKIARARRASAICSLWKICKWLFIPNCTTKIIWLPVNNIQVTISVTLQYFTWQMEATSHFNFIGWKFDVNSSVKIHSLQVMYENWAVSFNCEKQSLPTVEYHGRTWPESKGKKLACGLDAAFLPNVFWVIEKLWAV